MCELEAQSFNLMPLWMFIQITFLQPPHTFLIDPQTTADIYFDSLM